MIIHLTYKVSAYLFTTLCFSSMLVAMEGKFNESIRDIKQQCNLHSFRKGIQKLDPCLISEMISNPDIKHYLQRPIETTSISKDIELRWRISGKVTWNTLKIIDLNNKLKANNEDYHE